MTNVLSPMVAVAVYVGGTLGPSGVMTGWVFLNALAIAGFTYLFCAAIDLAVATFRRS